VKGIIRMHCTVVQCSGGNLRPPSLLLMLVEEGRGKRFHRRTWGIFIFVGHVICIVISKSTVPVWAKTEERGYLGASAVFRLVRFGYWVRLGHCGYAITRGEGTREDEINFRKALGETRGMRYRDDILTI
jgi:hypothetical protein